jgi:hypothetical protein
MITITSIISIVQVLIEEESKVPTSVEQYNNAITVL